MTRKQWVRQMPWQLAAAGAVAGALFGVSALYSAGTAFADCGRGPANCNQSSGRSNNSGGYTGLPGGNPFAQPQQQPQQQQQQTTQFTGRTQNNNQGGNTGQNNGGQNGQTLNLPQWQNNQQQNNSPRGNTQTPPTTVNQGVQQFIQQLTEKWQQPDPPQVTIPAYVPPAVVPQVVVQQPVVQPPVVQPFVQAAVVQQVVANPPAPAPIVNVQTNTNRRRSNNPPPVVNVPTVAEVVAAVSPLFAPPVNIDPPAPKFVNRVANPVAPNFVPPVQQAAAAPAPVNQNAVGPNFFNNPNNPNDPWWWWWNHHQHQHNPPPPPPPPPPVVYVPPPVVYQPQVFHRTVTSCASVQPNYQQTVYPYSNLGVPYGYQGMPYGYNPNIFNQPVAPNYAPIYGYGQGSIYQPGYPYIGNQYNVAYPGFNRTIFFNGGYPYANNGYPVGYNNVFYNNGNYNNGYPYGNQSWEERVNIPQGILIIHHVLVACPQPVQQVVYQAPLAVPSTPSYQQVSAAPQAIAPPVYAPVVQQSRGIAPPRTGDAGLLTQSTSSNAWLPDFVLVGLLSVFSVGLMARARQR